MVSLISKKIKCRMVGLFFYHPVRPANVEDCKLKSKSADGIVHESNVYILPGNYPGERIPKPGLGMDLGFLRMHCLHASW